MLTIFNLHARVADKEILRGINLKVNAGEVHAIMGPNGSGKSTLAGVLAGRDAYDVTEGDVLFEGKNLLDMDPEERAREGRLPRLSVSGRDSRRHQHLLPARGRQRRSQASRASPNSTRVGVPQARQGEAEGAAHDGRSAQAARQRRLLRRREEAQRDLPDGGARAEAVHPRRDRLRPRHRRPADRRRRRQRPAQQGPGHARHHALPAAPQHIVPDKVHVLFDGRIVKSGGKELALELEQKGYDWIKESIKQPAGV